MTRGVPKQSPKDQKEEGAPAAFLLVRLMHAPSTHPLTNPLVTRYSNSRQGALHHNPRGRRGRRLLLVGGSLNQGGAEQKQAQHHHQATPSQREHK